MPDLDPPELGNQDPEFEALLRHARGTVAIYEALVNLLVRSAASGHLEEHYARAMLDRLIASDDDILWVAVVEGEGKLRELVRSYRAREAGAS